MKTIIRLWIYVAMFLLAPTWARGQGVPPESVEVRVVQVVDGYPQTQVIAARETAIMPSGSRCGQPKTGPNPSLLNPTKVAMDDPFAGASVDCVVPMPLEIPDGTNYVVYSLYRASNCLLEDGVSRGPCMSGYSNYTQPFTVAQGPPPDPCAGAVVLSVGDWTRQAPARTLARVTYSLLKSQHPITRLIVKLNGAVQDNLTANDLTRVAGSYFLLPSTPGNYSLTVEAQDANGCSDGSNRPMTVVVQ